MANYSPVQAGFGAPQRQNRWKVAFRLVLAIPLLLWFFLLSIAAGFLIVIGWFTSLILGRLPHSFVRPLSDYIVFVTRMYSYVYLMNDAYPPFSDKRDFGVNLVIPSSKVRRSAVLFRIILIIPVAIVSALVAIGVEIASIFIWLIVLVKGEMPLPLFGALAAVLRYQARFYAYYMMITSKYPGELFGDEPTAPNDLSTTPEGVLSPSPLIVEPPVHLGMDESVADEPANEFVTSSFVEDIDEPKLVGAPGAPTGAPTEFITNESPSAPESPPRTARLVLSQGSRRILVTFLVLGVLGYAAQTVLQPDCAITNRRWPDCQPPTTHSTVKYFRPKRRGRVARSPLTSASSSTSLPSLTASPPLKSRLTTPVFLQAPKPMLFDSKRQRKSSLPSWTSSRVDRRSPRRS